VNQQSSPARDRVNILYKDHDTSQEKELPLKILVIGDYTGLEDDRPLEERKPIRIDRGNFGAVMAEHGLRLRFNAPDTISGDPNDTLAVDLKFSSFADFGPEWVAQQVPELRALIERRRNLSELKPWFDGSPSLVARIARGLADPEVRAFLRIELGFDASGSTVRRNALLEGSDDSVLEWVVAGAGIGPASPDFQSLREGVEAYLRARLPEFPAPAAAPGPAPAPAPASEPAPASDPPATLDPPPAIDGAGLLDAMLEAPVVVTDSRMQAGERLKPEQIIIDKPGLDVLIVEIDRMLASQVDAILHYPAFQALEAAWRSLRFLVSGVNFRENVQVHLLNCKKDDLIADFEDAPEIAKSGLYRLVYATEYGTFGGEPYGVICADYQFDAGPVDMALLSSCAAVATMSHVPFIANAAPRFFGEESFDNLATYDDVRAIFQTPLYTRWHSFRDSEDSRYVALCLPKFLLREPYQRHDVEAFCYAEKTVSKRDYLWGHASFAFCTRVADSFARYRWSPNIVGPTAGGGVDGLTQVPFASMHGIEVRMPTEIQLTERHEYELSEEGFMGLVYLKGTDNACFFSANSCQKPKTFQKTPEGREAELGARLGAQLPYIFIVCRIAHYLKVLQREEIGRHLERSDLERELNDWLRKYVSDMDNPAPAVRGKRPLRQARVMVEEVPGQAGWYRAHLLLRPHLKYMGASFTLSLVGKLEREAG
jgi:type VI secretion system protein ImpC